MWCGLVLLSLSDGSGVAVDWLTLLLIDAAAGWLASPLGVLGVVVWQVG